MIVNFIIPGDINLPTGGYRYDKRILQEWDQSGVRYNLIGLEGDFPLPTIAQVEKAIASIKEFPKADISVVDGLAGGAVPGFMEQLSLNTPTVALIHHPLCLENGLTGKDAEHLENTERQGLESVQGVITTSPNTSRTVERLFEFPSKNIETVLPGVDRGKQASPYISGPVRLLCVGSLIERKGHRYLIEALAELHELNWKLDCFGLIDKGSKIFQEIDNLVREHDLHHKVRFHGSVSDQVLEQAYADAHLFVLPSLFEGYGMAYAEAIVRGLPVIGTTAGAIPETVPATCGMLVEPANTKSLSNALRHLITDTSVLEQYRLGSINATDDFPTWKTSAMNFKEILEQWA